METDKNVSESSRESHSFRWILIWFSKWFFKKGSPETIACDLNTRFLSGKNGRRKNKSPEISEKLLWKLIFLRERHSGIISHFPPICGGGSGSGCGSGADRCPRFWFSSVHLPLFTFCRNWNAIRHVRANRITFPATEENHFPWNPPEKNISWRGKARKLNDFQFVNRSFRSRTKENCWNNRR